MCTLCNFVFLVNLDVHYLPYRRFLSSRGAWKQGSQLSLALTFLTAHHDYILRRYCMYRNAIKLI